MKKCSILNEEAKYRGKTKPFFHQILGGTAFFTIMGEPSFYVGLRIITKSDETLAIYVSTKPVYFNTDAYFADRAEAEKIQKVFQAIIKKVKQAFFLPYKADRINFVKIQKNNQSGIQ